MRLAISSKLRGYGRFAFRLALRTPGLSFRVRKRIGGSGNFWLDGCFMFSDFSRWGSGKNIGFSSGLNTIKRGDVVLDIGAHVGLFTLPAAVAVGPEGVVISFEPAPRNAYLLKRHIKLNRLAEVVDVVEALVGEDEASTVPFHVMGHDSGLNSVVRPKPDGFIEIAMPMTTIDALCSRRNLKPDLIKIDIEGAELMALRGARRTLERDRPKLLLSVHPWHLTKIGHSVGEVERLLDDLGYQPFDDQGNAVEKLHGEEYLVKPRAEGSY